MQASILWVVSGVCLISMQHSINAHHRFHPLSLMTGEGIPCVLGVVLFAILSRYGERVPGDLFWFLTTVSILSLGCICAAFAHLYLSRELWFFAAMLFMSAGVQCFGVGYLKGCDPVVSTSVIALAPAITCFTKAFQHVQMPTLQQCVLLGFVAGTAVMAYRELQTTAPASGPEFKERSVPALSDTADMEKSVTTETISS